MKKRLLALVVASAMTVGLTGCGGSTAGAGKAAGTDPGDAGADTKAVGNTAADAGGAASEIILKYAELNSDDNINARAGYEFAKYVDELSNGRIKVEIYSASTLGDEKTCLNALQMGGGTVD